MPRYNRHSARKTEIGFVSSKMGDKSVKVTVPYKTPHSLYRKVINRKTILHVHDEKNEADIGDKVEVMEIRPMSRLKRWRIVNVIERATNSSLSISENDVAANTPGKILGEQAVAVTSKG